MATEAELRSQIDRTLDIMDRSAKAVHDFFVFEVEQIGRTKFTAPYIAEKLENTYTALENQGVTATSAILLSTSAFLKSLGWMLS